MNTSRFLEIDWDRYGEGEHQERVSEIVESLPFLQHAAYRFAQRLHPARLAHGDLADTAQGRQRGPQLVRGIGGEAAQRIKGSLEPLQGFDC